MTDRQALGGAEMTAQDLLATALASFAPAHHINCATMTPGKGGSNAKCDCYAKRVREQAQEQAGSILAASPALAQAIELGLSNPDLVSLWQDYQHVTKDGNPTGLSFMDYIVARATPRTYVAVGTNG